MPKRRSGELAAIDEVIPLVDRFNELEHAQRLIFLDMVDPLPEEAGAPTEKPTKTTTKRKIERCEVCNYTRRALQHVNPQHTEYHEFVKAEKASKKSSTKPVTKSERSSGMAAQLNRNRQQRETTKEDSDDDYDPCQYDYGEDGKRCGAAPDDNVHHKQSHPEFHPFVSLLDAAPPAPVSSPANGASSATERSTRKSAHTSTLESDDEAEQSASLSIVGSETGSDDAGSVVQGASGGG